MFADTNSKHDGVAVRTQSRISCRMFAAPMCILISLRNRSERTQNTLLTNGNNRAHKQSYTNDRSVFTSIGRFVQDNVKAMTRRRVNWLRSNVLVQSIRRELLDEQRRRDACPIFAELLEIFVRRCRCRSSVGTELSNSELFVLARLVP